MAIFVINQRELSMINCEECNKYAQNIFQRGEISQDEINKLALDRHILKGCDYVGEVGEVLTLVERNEGGTITVAAGEYRIINGQFYKIEKSVENPCLQANRLQD